MARSREFDESALVDAATDVFWRRGYGGASVVEISELSGVGNGSIYAAFGNKWGLFERAFERYCAGRVALVRDSVDAAPGSTERVLEALYAAIIDDCASHPDQRGCLMLNSIGELGGSRPDILDMAGRATASMEHAVAERFMRDPQTRAALGTDGITALSGQAIALAQGLIQLSRQGAERARLERIASAHVRG